MGGTVTMVGTAAMVAMAGKAGTFLRKATERYLAQSEHYYWVMFQVPP